MKSLSEQTVVVGMSGGVDSAVSALLLKQQGYRVIGLFMKNWDEKDENGRCRSAEDFEDVALTCETLDIPYYSVEFVQEYWENVFQDFLQGYKKGHAPNPDVLCNREIKFKAFYQKALDFGADWIATGHYAQKEKIGEQWKLVRGKDPSKDQSYFLYTIKSKTLEKVLFPIGHLLKTEVRKKAVEAGLPVHSKKDSTGICFIGERNFPEFLSKYLSLKKGEFQNLEGTPVGHHRGAAFYTLGQRKGLDLGGQGDRWYVVGKDMDKNIVYVERGGEHPALYVDELTVEEVSWVNSEPKNLKCMAKIRYQQADQECELVSLGESRFKVLFKEPQRAVVPGQSVVFYQDQVCLGGGIIQKAGESYYSQSKPLPQNLLNSPRRASSVRA